MVFDVNENFVKTSDLVYKAYLSVCILNNKEANGATPVRTYLSNVRRQGSHSSSQSHPFKAAIIVNDNAVRQGKEDPPIPRDHSK
jgi:hypothetical protein